MYSNMNATQNRKVMFQNNPKYNKKMKSINKKVSHTYTL